VLDRDRDDDRASKRARVEDEQGTLAQEVESNEPVIVIEEEVDPEKVLEERRRKREEIMARFKAQKAAGLAGAPSAAGGVAKEQLLGTGADSVTSGGTRTGLTTTGRSTFVLIMTSNVDGDLYMRKY
jgi:serine/threonine-protein kinase PRP4